MGRYRRCEDVCMKEGSGELNVSFGAETPTKQSK